LFVIIVILMHFLYHCMLCIIVCSVSLYVVVAQGYVEELTSEVRVSEKFFFLTV